MKLVVGRKELRDIRLVHTKVRRLQGRVIVQGNHPQPRASYEAITRGMRPSPGNGVMTDSDGTFVLVVPEGEHKFEISGYAPPYRIRSIQYGNTDLLKKPLKVHGKSHSEILVTFDVDPAPWRRVSGRVIIDESRFAAIDHVRVTLEGRTSAIALKAELKSQGYFEFPEVLPGTYVLSTEPNIAGMTNKTIEVAERDISDADLVVPLQRKITVLAQTATGAPPPSYTLVLKSLDGRGYQISTVSTLLVFIQRTDFACISDSCTTARLGSSIFDPGLIYSARSYIPSGSEFDIDLPGVEYHFEVQLHEPHKLRSAHYGSTDLLREPLRLQGQDSPKIVLTFDQ
jgi:hypothetical protein